MPDGVPVWLRGVQWLSDLPVQEGHRSPHGRVTSSVKFSSFSNLKESFIVLLLDKLTSPSQSSLKAICLNFEIKHSNLKFKLCQF